MTQAHETILALLEQVAIAEPMRSMLRNAFSSLSDEDAGPLADLFGKRPDVLRFLAENIDDKMRVARNWNPDEWAQLIKGEAAFLEQL